MSDKKADETDSHNDLDYVLSDVGEFGIYQIGQCIAMVLPIILSATYAVEFIVTSSTDDYRCAIPECEWLNNTIYDQNWLSHAIPFKNGRPKKCSRFGTSHQSAPDGQCPKSLFNESNVIGCNEYVFKTDEYRIMREFGILCDENEYKLALVGTVNNIGGFLFMPLTGLLSDKFGRLTVLIVGMVSCAIFGLIKAFVGSYMWYMVLEFLCAAVGTTTYMAAFVLCVEWVSSKYRILASTTIAATYPGGEILLGVMAMLLPNYRAFLSAIYTPALLLAFYFWLVPESTRWLIATGQYERAMKILKRTAKQNNREMSEKSMEIVRNSCTDAKGSGKNGENDCSSIIAIFQNKILLIRLIMCSLCWISVVFVFYGLSVNATKITDDSNKYLSYITTMAAEVPAALITFFMLKYIGRRTAMCCTMTIAASVTILSTFVPSHYTLIIRIMFFVGMCATSSSFAILYVFSAEIWPTGMRNLLMNICSMIGRFGSMLAPLAILLSHYKQNLPLLLFGSAALICGFIIFMLPETKGKKLPHTVQDAIKL
ncbi:organic cation transporter protein-like [Sitodiplosis mosellana]|uniref:organic cation transporter protein-like n=1 Tax=Sitodiplosis mosellana TaxID=263140 RepID=UPI002443DD93|nr:organic cation transporter protein-like [Sitodiplosis mosellana]